MLEGGYQLHEVSGDRGGMTYAGIARNAWPKWPGWVKIDAGEMDGELTGLVRTFYKDHFWDKIRGDGITAQQVAYQRIVGATPDGIFGDMTFQRINNMVRDEKDERIFVVTFSLFKVFRYKDICMNDSRRGQDRVNSNLKFLCGWINRVQKGLE